MSKNKSTLGGRAKKDSSLVRSSAAEYLTFVAASGAGGVEAVYADENVWLTQKMMGSLYDVETHTINYHLKQIFADSELQENSVIRNFRIAAPEARGQVIMGLTECVAQLWSAETCLRFCGLSDLSLRQSRVQRLGSCLMRSLLQRCLFFFAAPLNAVLLGRQVVPAEKRRQVPALHILHSSPQP